VGGYENFTVEAGKKAKDLIDQVTERAEKRKTWRTRVMHPEGMKSEGRTALLSGKDEQPKNKNVGNTGQEKKIKCLLRI